MAKIKKASQIKYKKYSVVYFLKFKYMSRKLLLQQYDSIRTVMQSNIETIKQLIKQAADLRDLSESLSESEILNYLQLLNNYLIIYFNK